MPTIFVDYLNPADTDVTLPNTTQIALTPTGSGYAHNNKPVKAIVFDLDTASVATIFTTGAVLPDPQIVTASFHPTFDPEPLKVTWISGSSTSAKVDIEPANTYSGSLSHAGGSVLVAVQH